MRYTFCLRLSVLPSSRCEPYLAALRGVCNKTFTASLHDRRAVGPYSASSHAPLRPHKRDDDAAAARRGNGRALPAVQQQPCRVMCAESIGFILKLPRFREERECVHGDDGAGGRALGYADLSALTLLCAVAAVNTCAPREDGGFMLHEHCVSFSALRGMLHHRCYTRYRSPLSLVDVLRGSP